MDERISKALVELRRAGISPAVFAAEAARAGQAFNNEEVMDFIWSVAEQRGKEEAIRELGPEGKAGKPPKKTRLAVVKWLALQGMLEEILGLRSLEKDKGGLNKEGLNKYKPEGLATLRAWLSIFPGAPRMEPLYDTELWPGVSSIAPTTYTAPPNQ